MTALRTALRQAEGLRLAVDVLTGPDIRPCPCCDVTATWADERGRHWCAYCYSPPAGAPWCVAFTVPGCPQPKQRARRGRNGAWYTPSATAAYEDKLGWLARQAGIRVPHDGPVRLTVRLWFPDRRRRDMDNIVKALQDGLNGIAWADDSQVIELRVTRYLDRQRPRAEVIVEALP